MIMYRTDLSDFPANCNQLIDGSLVYEIACIVLAVPMQKGRKRVGVDWRRPEKVNDLIARIERGLGELSQSSSKILNGNSFGVDACIHLYPQPFHSE